MSTLRLPRELVRAKHRNCAPSETTGASLGVRVRHIQPEPSLEDSDGGRQFLL